MPTPPPTIVGNDLIMPKIHVSISSSVRHPHVWVWAMAINVPQASTKMHMYAWIKFLIHRSTFEGLTLISLRGSIVGDEVGNINVTQNIAYNVSPIFVPSIVTFYFL